MTWLGSPATRWARIKSVHRGADPTVHAHLRALLGHASDILVVLNADGNIIAANDEWEQYLVDVGGKPERARIGADYSRCATTRPLSSWKARPKSARGFARCCRERNA